MQPTNQYNIIEKIKEANQELYSVSVLRVSSPKVKFREKLVEFEPEFDEDGILMEKRSNSSNSSHRKEEESSDDCYVEDTNNNNNSYINSHVIMNVSNVNSEEIEEVCEQLDGELEISEKEEHSDATESVPEEHEDYFKNDFNDEELDEISKSPELLQEKSIIRKCCEDRDKKPDVQRCFPKRVFTRSKSTKTNPITTDISNDVTNLCRNKVKTCCKHKESDEYKQKLPKYNGAHYSNYGLSLEEIAKRQRKEQKSIHIKHRKEEQQFEQKELLSKNNEEAFAKW